jgi:NAD(P)-dependent dehydrogenase (short-subunit alcohol dehydrogenase family)
MHPKPDDGEPSYRQSARLLGRNALITGGDSGIGRAAAIAYAREGAGVAINDHPIEEPDAREVLQLIKQMVAALMLSDWISSPTCSGVVGRPGFLRCR